MNGVDPMADKYSSLTPYNYSFNMPNMVVDVNGADPSSNYFYGSYYTYDDFVPQQYLGEAVCGRCQMENSKLFRNFGESLVNLGYNMGLGSFLSSAMSSANGGNWSNGSGFLFKSQDQAFAYGTAYNDRHSSWGYTRYGNEQATTFAYTWARATGSEPLRETVNYWMNRRNEILYGLSQPTLLASNSNIVDSPDVLGILKKSSMLAMRMALHIPDAISLSLDIDLATPQYGTDITPFGSIKILTGPYRGEIVNFGDIAWAQGVDISIAIKITEFYYTGDASTLSPNSFRGWRISANGAFILGGLDLGIGLTYAPNTSAKSFLGSFKNAMIGISRSIGYGVSTPFPVSGNLNLGYTWLWRDFLRD